jgi:hypothetical protein
MPRDHAADAAKLLRRLAVFIAAIALPAIALVARNSAAIVLPLVAALVTFANFVDPEREPFTPRIYAGLRSPAILALGYLCLWLAVSLAWTPFPASAAGRLGAALAVVAVCVVAVLGLPGKMRASTLNLIPIGVFLAALAVAGVAVASLYEVLPAFLVVERFIFERGVALICLLAFAGAGWLMSRGRVIDAIALLVVVVAAMAVWRSFPSSLAFAVGLVAFFLSRLNAGLAAFVVVAAVFASILVVPVAALAIPSVDPAWLGVPEGDAAALIKFAASIAGEWQRLITGHGYDTLRFANRAGLLPAELRLPHLELWYEAGLPGAFAAMWATVALARRAVRSKAGVGSAALGVLAAGATYAGLGQAYGYGLSQGWWLSTVALAVFALASIERGQVRTTRPRAKLQKAGR